MPMEDPAANKLEIKKLNEDGDLVTTNAGTDAKFEGRDGVHVPLNDDNAAGLDITDADLPGDPVAEHAKAVQRHGEAAGTTGLLDPKVDDDSDEAKRREHDERKSRAEHREQEDKRRDTVQHKSDTHSTQSTHTPPHKKK